MSQHVEYAEIKHWWEDLPKGANGTEMYVDGRNVQIDYKSVTVGTIVQIAMKSDVRPPSRKTFEHNPERLIAPYVQKVVVRHDVCSSCEHDTDNPNQTICPECIDSWCLDWLVRHNRNWMEHGHYRIYSGYGCRCAECRYANALYLSGGKRGNVRRGRLRGSGMTPSATVKDPERIERNYEEAYGPKD